jgi:hypothetical protein
MTVLILSADGQQMSDMFWIRIPGEHMANGQSGYIHCNHATKQYSIEETRKGACLFTKQGAEKYLKLIKKSKKDASLASIAVVEPAVQDTGTTTSTSLGIPIPGIGLLNVADGKIYDAKGGQVSQSSSTATASATPYECKQCHKIGPWKTCARCGHIFYCGRECQVKHWPLHRPYCKRSTTQARLADSGDARNDIVMPTRTDPILSTSTSSSAATEFIEWHEMLEGEENSILDVSEEAKGEPAFARCEQKWRRSIRNLSFLRSTTGLLHELLRIVADYQSELTLMGRDWHLMAGTLSSDSDLAEDIHLCLRMALAPPSSISSLAVDLIMSTRLPTSCQTLVIYGPDNSVYYYSLDPTPLSIDEQVHRVACCPAIQTGSRFNLTILDIVWFAQQVRLLHCPSHTHLADWGHLFIRQIPQMKRWVVQWRHKLITPGHLIAMTVFLNTYATGGQFVSGGSELFMELYDDDGAIDTKQYPASLTQALDQNQMSYLRLMYYHPESKTWNDAGAKGVDWVHGGAFESISNRLVRLMGEFTGPTGPAGPPIDFDDGPTGPARPRIDFDDPDLYTYRDDSVHGYTGGFGYTGEFG